MGTVKWKNERYGKIFCTGPTTTAKAGKKSTGLERQAHWTNHGRISVICTPWVPVCFSFSSQQWPLLSSLSVPHHTVHHSQLFSIPTDLCPGFSPLHSTMIQISHRFIDAYSTHSGSWLPSALLRIVSRKEYYVDKLYSKGWLTSGVLLYDFFNVMQLQSTHNVRQSDRLHLNRELLAGFGNFGLNRRT